MDEHKKEERKLTAHQTWMMQYIDVIKVSVGFKNSRLSNRELKNQIANKLISEFGKHSTTRLQVVIDELIAKADKMQEHAKKFEAQWKECPWIRFKKKKQLRLDFEYSYVACEAWKEAIKIVTNTFPK